MKDRSGSGSGCRLSAVGVAALLVLASPPAGETSTPPPKRSPNILVIMSDEHNAGVMGCTGNRIVRTPNLDRLGREGIVFEACYTNSPLCVPSRLSFTAGKYISRIGAWNNDCRLPSDDCPSLPALLNAAGYESFLCGKMHYDAAHRYGFRDVGGNMNRGKMAGRGSRRAADDLKPAAGISNRFQEFRAGDTSGVLKHDRAVTEGTVAFLRDRRADDKPFFLLAGYLAPHFPLIVPEAYWERYKGKVPMPEIPPGHLEGLPLNYRHLRVGFNVEDVPPDVVRKGRELYYGLTEWLDEEVGKVLAALRASAAANGTIVVYTADHGENMGEHGLWWKNCMYEHAARVPLIFAWPGRWAGGQRRTKACSLVDVVRTLTELGGAKAPADWDGASLVAWIDDPGAPWRDMAVSEYYAHNIASGFAMIRKGRFKYVAHASPDAGHPAERELYDLEADPGEFANLAGRPEQANRLREMHRALVEALGEEPDRTEQRCRADGARGYGRGK